MKKKLVDELIDANSISIMLGSGCTAVELIAKLNELIKEYGDSVELVRDDYSYDEMSLAGRYKRLETNEEFAKRKVRSEKYKKSAVKRKKTLRKKNEKELEILQKEVKRLQKRLEKPS